MITDIAALTLAITTPEPVQRILDQFAGAKPAEERLGFFTLDWA